MTIYYLPIPVPAIIDRIGVAILLFYRKKRYDCAFRKIKLTQGKYAIVDPDDFEGLNKFKWYAIKSFNNFYARRMVYINGKSKVVQMHRRVKKYEGELFIDHINGDGLDNRKDNLRLATPLQNIMNRSKMNGSVSKYKGVSKHRQNGNKWQALICYKGKRIHLGYFDNEIDAAKAYDEAAKELYREYAKLNFG